MAHDPSPTDEQIASAIRTIADANESITARAVARRLGVAPSTITRSPKRMELLRGAQDTQAALRSIVERQNKTGKEELLKQIVDRDIKISALEERVRILVSSHKAMLLAVGELGGTAKWLRFFADHQQVLSSLREMGALSSAQNVSRAQKLTD